MLTKLERHIKACALMAIRRIGKIEVEHQFKTGIFLFICDGVYDELIYDFEKKKFIEIRYAKCVGETFNPFNPFYPMVGYSDNIEIKTIPLDT